jgi:hypothetical protein
MRRRGGRLLWFFVDLVEGDPRVIARRCRSAVVRRHPRSQRSAFPFRVGHRALNVGLGGWCGRSEGPGEFFGSSRILLHAAHHRKRWRAHHAQHRVPHVGRGGAHQASLGTSGTADGGKRGRGPSAFFQAPHCRQQRPTVCHPSSPDARSREPSPSDDRGGNAPALWRSENSQDRASGVRKGWIRCASGWPLPRRMIGMSMRGLLKKILMAPHCVGTIRATRRSTPMSNPKRGNALPASGMPPNDG